MVGEFGPSDQDIHKSLINNRYLAQVAWCASAKRGDTGDTSQRSHPGGDLQWIDPIAQWGSPQGSSSCVTRMALSLFFSFFFEFEFGLDRPSVFPNDSFRPRSHMHSQFHVPRVYTVALRNPPVITDCCQSHRRMETRTTQGNTLLMPRKPIHRC